MVLLISFGFRFFVSSLLIIIKYIRVPWRSGSCNFLPLFVVELLLEASNPFKYLSFKSIILIFTEIMLALSLEALLIEIELIVVIYLICSQQKFKCFHFEMAGNTNAVTFPGLEGIHQRLSFHDELESDRILSLLHINGFI